jgi:peptidoglycan-N-acetylglucosamine deacetylase
MKKIIVTTSWDDGHKLDFKVSQLLKKYSLKGTFYVAPKNREFNKTDLLTDQEIIGLGKTFEIGAHTMTHPLLPNDLATSIYKIMVKVRKTLGREHYKLSPNLNWHEAREEILGSKVYLQSLLNKNIVSFCYPAGRHNLIIRKLVKECGFKYARTVDEYSFSLPKNAFESGTTIHANRHLRDIFQKAQFSKWNVGEIKKNTDWEYLAKRMFDRVAISGGVFHLWGHSWLIQKNNDWGKLERVLSYIANRDNTEYLTNGQLTERSFS